MFINYRECVCVEAKLQACERVWEDGRWDTERGTCWVGFFKKNCSHMFGGMKVNEGILFSRSTNCRLFLTAFVWLYSDSSPRQLESEGVHIFKGSRSPARFLGDNIWWHSAGALPKGSAESSEQKVKTCVRKYLPLVKNTEVKKKKGKKKGLCARRRSQLWWQTSVSGRKIASIRLKSKNLISVCWVKAKDYSLQRANKSFICLN